MNHVQSLKCDFYGGGHENERCLFKGVSEEAQFANFQKNNPYSNTYNPGWKVHPNFRWSNNQNQSDNQAMQQNQQASNFQKKPSHLKETLQIFIKVTQISLEPLNRNRKILARNHDAPIKNLETQIDQLSRQISPLSSSSGRFTGNTVDNPKNETCKVLEVDLGLVTIKEEIEKAQENKIKGKKVESEKEENRNQGDEEKRGVTLD